MVDAGAADSYNELWRRARPGKKLTAPLIVFMQPLHMATANQVELDPGERTGHGLVSA